MSLTRLSRIIFAAVLAAALPGTVFGQHLDIEYTYGPDRIEVEFGAEGRVFEGDFELTGVAAQTTEEPGFEGDISSGEIVYNVLSSLLFWDGTDFAPVTPGTQIRIGNFAAPDTLITDTSGTQLGAFSTAPGGALNRIGNAATESSIGDEGEPELHRDLEWFLEPLPFQNAGTPATGAYGVLLSLSTSESGIDDSAEFFIVQNFGLPEEQFEAGVEAFAALVPEPTSLALLGTATIVLGLTRRRRESGLQQQA